MGDVLCVVDHCHRSVIIIRQPIHLQLRGLVTNQADRRQGVVLKSIGEDISAGKVTIPVAKAVSRLPKEEMRELWETVSQIDG